MRQVAVNGGRTYANESAFFVPHDVEEIDRRIDAKFLQFHVETD
jgi:hypothetical protein